MLRSDLCHYSDVYIVAKGRITVTDTNNANRRKKSGHLRIMVRSYISKISNTFIDNM